MNKNKIMVGILLILIFISIYIIYNDQLKFRLYKEKVNRDIEKLKLEVKDFDHAADEAVRLMANMEVEKTNCEARNEMLKNKLYLINKSLQQTKKIKENIKNNFINLRENASQTISEIKQYKKELEDSMEWFKENSILTTKQGSAKNNIKGKCLDIKNNICKIKLGCFHLVNKEYLGLKYIYDITSTGEADKLLGLDSFIQNNGGDCEDYSLFFKAEMNYLKERCDKIELESWTMSNTNEKYWLDKNNVWYMENVKGVVLKEGYIHPTVVCGMIKDTKGILQGHCIVAFTQRQIENRDDLELLKGSPIIEPQDGHYLGIINEDSGIYLKENYYDNYPSYITLVITDNNLFYLSNSKRQWVSYKYFYNSLDKQEKELELYTK